MRNREFYLPPGAEKIGIYNKNWIDFNKNGVKDPYEDPSKPIEERVEDLLNRMTLEEKVSQLQSSFEFKEVGNLSCILRALPPEEGAKLANEVQRKLIEGTRLGIPALIHDECLHGCLAKYSTQFPQAIALAATWDPDLVYRVAKAVAKETRARGIHQCLSPVVNLARDIRAGRTEETYGEDPYLTSVMGEAYCRALREEYIVATPKHFVANFEAEGGRDSHEAHFSELILREVFLPPFRACIRAGALSVMAAYNSLDGIACSSNRWLLTDLLRKEWGFEGFVVSDYGSVSGIIYQHSLANTRDLAAKLALEAGLEVELPSVDIFGEELLKAIKKGLIPMEVINEAVRRVLRVKFLVGLFDNPFVDPGEAKRIIGSEEHRYLALEASRKAIVLLKNEHNLLPLNKGKLKKLLVVGGAAKQLKLGGYSGEPGRAITPLDAIRDELRGCQVEVNYVEACPIGLDYWSAIHNWLPGLRLGYLAPPEDMRGDGVRIEIFDAPDFQGSPVVDTISLHWGGFRYEWGYRRPHQLIKNENYSVRFSGRLLPPMPGRYAFCLGVAGGKARLILGTHILAEIDATGISTYKIVETEIKGEQSFVLEFVRTRGYAGVRLGWDIVDCEEMRKAIELAREADAVIFFADIIEGEEKDRAVLRLPRSQERMIEKLLEVNTNIIVVLVSGSPVVGDWIYRVPAFLQAWYPGQEGGKAIADILFGNFSPSGRLPFTWPHHEGQLPLYYNYKPSGRVYDYVNMTGAPLFPFGHGLSYTKFEYSDLNINVIEGGKLVEVAVTVSNAGDRESDEVVQMYIRDLVSSVARPIKELKGFKRVNLKPGEHVRIMFQLKPDDLAFFNERMRRVVEPGEFLVMVGSSSEDIRLKGTFTVEKRFEAKFELKSIDFERQGNEVTVRVEVMNIGEVTDTVKVILRLDGIPTEMYPIELGPGETRSTVFRLKEKEFERKHLEVTLDWCMLSSS
ncbi:MAG: glycoside hydrolase family 3 N-terminal domain-containing protein [Thermofilaceae archaeon]